MIPKVMGVKDGCKAPGCDVLQTSCRLPEGCELIIRIASGEHIGTERVSCLRQRVCGEGVNFKLDNFATVVFYTHPTMQRLLPVARNLARPSTGTATKLSPPKRLSPPSISVTAPSCRQYATEPKPPQRLMDQFKDRQAVGVSGGMEIRINCVNLSNSLTVFENRSSISEQLHCSSLPALVYSGTSNVKVKKSRHGKQPKKSIKK